MTVWLVAEDRVQILRADSVITFTAVPVKPVKTEYPDPVAQMPGNDRIQILAATATARNAGDSPWTALLTFKGGGRAAVKALEDLAEIIGEAERRTRMPGGKPVLYVHGPRPGQNLNPQYAQVWQVSEKLPVKAWPSSGSFFKDPLP